MALGVQDKFSWRNVATSALTGGLTQYAGLNDLPDSNTSSLVSNAIQRNAISQGVNMLVGQQHGFSWQSMAVSAITAPANYAANDALFGTTNTPGLISEWAQNNRVGAVLVGNTVSAAISATTRVAVVGGRLSWAAVAGDTLTGFAQSAAMGMMDSAQQGGAGNGADGLFLSPEDVGVADWRYPTYAEQGRMVRGGGLMYTSADGQMVGEDRLALGVDPANVSADDALAMKKQIEWDNQAETSPYNVGMCIVDGSDLTGKPLRAYGQALVQNPGDFTSARDAALGAAIAEQITTLRAQIVAGTIRDPDGSFSHQLNVATDALLGKDSYYKNGIPELLPVGVQRLWTNSELAPLNINNEMLQPKDGSGYMAGAYYDANRSTYVIANKGTASLPDWKTDGGQAFGFKTQQYEDAANIAEAISISVAGKAGQVEYTGHSLGAGLGSLQALIGNAPGVTFNAAGLNSATAQRYGVDIHAPNKIDAYYVNGEPLSWVQDHTTLPSATGSRIPLTPDAPVSMTSNGLVHSAPLTGWKTFTNSIDANLHFMGAVESSIYNNFPVFRLVNP